MEQQNRGGSDITYPPFPKLNNNLKVTYKMSESVKATKKSKKPVSKTFHQYGSTPHLEGNSSRLTLTSGTGLRRLMSSSLEKLSFVSENDSCANADIENYDLEYSMYLLRKAQNKLLSKDKEIKEEKMKKCFVSLKFELEDLFEKYVKLCKDIAYYQMFLEDMRQANRNIEIGKKILEQLKEKDFEVLLKSISNSLTNAANQIHLVDINKTEIEEALSNNILGPESELNKCLKNINSCTENIREEISKIASEILAIEKLLLQNSKLQESFTTMFETISNDILEANYKTYTEAVKEAFARKEESLQTSYIDKEFDVKNIFKTKVTNPQQLDSFQISELDGSYPLRPNSASTPQPD